MTQLTLELHLGADALKDQASCRGLALLQEYFAQGAISPIQVVVARAHGALTDQDLDVVARS